MSNRDLDKRGPRFSPGDCVRVADRSVAGHCRTPFYLRGKRGKIVSLAGRHRDPEKLAYQKPGLPERHLYRVRFEQSMLWNNEIGTVRDTLMADIYEHWLIPTARE